jgi:hypothetical protein
LNQYGFEVIYNKYCGFYRSLDMIFYRLFYLSKKGGKLYSLLLKSGIEKKRFYLNLYDIMYVIARKR